MHKTFFKRTPEIVFLRFCRDSVCLRARWILEFHSNNI